MRQAPKRNAPKTADGQCAHCAEMAREVESLRTDCALMARAQKKLADQVERYRNKFDRLLVFCNELFDEGDGLNFNLRGTEGHDARKESEDAAG